MSRSSEAGVGWRKVEPVIPSLAVRTRGFEMKFLARAAGVCRHLDL